MEASYERHHNYDGWKEEFAFPGHCQSPLKGEGKLEAGWNL